MSNMAYQPYLRPAFIPIKGCKDYREECALFMRVDYILSYSGIEERFIELSVAQRAPNLAEMTEAQRNTFYQSCLVALRGNIARHLKNLAHREFCKLLPDSALLRWFVGIERLDNVKAYAKSTSDRYSHWLNPESLKWINQQLIQALAHAEHQDALDLNLAEELDFENLYFDSTCLKADIHYPTDWVLFIDLTRTLMKATVLIRNAGLLHRMPKEPLEFLSEMNALAMEMTASNRTKGAKKKRKKILRKMKKLARRIEGHAKAHLKILIEREDEIELSAGRIACIKNRIESVLAQVQPAIDQAHERIIGERRVAKKDKILSLYDHDVDILTRRKSTAQVEFGNKLWIGENAQGIIVDYDLDREQKGDTKHVIPALERLQEELNLPVKMVTGDRGLESVANKKYLESNGIYNALCPKNPVELAERLKEEPQLRSALKRRAGTEARVKIIIKDFMGDKPRAKGFEHRSMMVSWAVFAHNLWVVARLVQNESDEEALLQEELRRAA